MKTALVILFAASCMFFCACETMHQAGKEVGKPVGGALRAPQGVTEGAAEGYAGSKGSNPYNR